MSSNRFDGILKGAKGKQSKPDAQTSKQSDIQTSKHLDTSTSKAKSSSKDFTRTTLYLTKQLHKRLKLAGLEHDMEMSDIAEAAIAQWLDNHSDC